MASVNKNQFSKLTLGTVALGMDYGISNRAGMPSGDAAFKVLQAARQAGITTLDTARSYGTSEVLIGEFLQTLGAAADMHIVTKFKLRKRDSYQEDVMRQEVLESVRESLARLKTGTLPVCLLHMDRSLPLGKIAAFLPGMLEELKQKGLIGMGGVSVDDPAEAVLFVDNPHVEAFQVPVNIFDSRIVRNGALKRMEAGDKVVFARSVFLQGLFFMDPDRLAGNLTQAAPYIQALRDLASQEQMSVQQLAFSFVRDLPGITSVVFGAVTPEQVAQNAVLQRGPALPEALRKSAMEHFARVPVTVITPGYWKTT